MARSWQQDDGNITMRWPIANCLKRFVMRGLVARRRYADVAQPVDALANLAVPLLAGLLWQPQWALGYGIAFILYCLMGITDYFDGYLARANGAVSKLGIFLDPIADKIMVAAVILVLVAVQVINGASVIAGLIILLREIAVSGLREFLAQLQVSVPVSRLAKWKTTLQLVALGGLIWAGRCPAGHRCRWRRWPPCGGRRADAGHRLGLFARRPQAYG